MHVKDANRQVYKYGILSCSYLLNSIRALGLDLSSRNFPYDSESDFRDLRTNPSVRRSINFLFVELSDLQKE